MGAELAVVAEFGPFDAVAEEQHRRYTSAEPAEAVALHARHIGWVRAAGDVATARYLTYVAASALLDTGDAEACAALARELVAGAPSGTDAAWRAKALALGAQAALVLGRHGQALDDLAEASDLVEAAPPGRHNTASAGMALALALAQAGVHDEAESGLRGLLGPGAVVPPLHVLPALAVLLLTRGVAAELVGGAGAGARYAAALEVSLRWRREARAAGELAGAARSVACEAFAWQRLGDVAAARAAADGTDLLAALPLGRAERVAALAHLAGVAAAGGDFDGAREHLEAAVVVARRSGTGPWAAGVQAGLARVEVLQHGHHPAAERWRALAGDLLARSEAQSRSFASELAARRRVRQLVSQTDRMTEALREDPLTGLVNRRGLDEALRAAAREGRDVGACFVDVDAFKAINDGHSHEVGDAVLRRVAALVSGACRAGDLVARYGGDEIVVLTGAGAAETGTLAHRVHAAVAGHPWRELAPGLAVTVSVGLAASLPAAAVLAAADAALLAAKRGGRDRVVAAG